MQNILAMFPGQGSQSVGMGKFLYEEFQVARETFDEADDILGLPLKKLCFEGPADDLKLTANQQPAILTTSIAVWRVLKSESSLAPLHFAGHSLGEYSALVAAGYLDFSEAVRLVRLRGEAMQKAVPEGVGAMAAVIGYNPDELVSKCSVIDSSLGKVEVVNFNSPAQQIISGHKKAVDRVVELLTEEKIRCTLLPVSAPFHSSLMAPAREEMTPKLQDTQLKESDKKIFANLTGQIANPYTIDCLVKQIDSPVLWTKILEAAVEEKCQTFFEIGPGKVLFGLARRSVPKEMKLLHSDDIKKAISDAQGLNT